MNLSMLIKSAGINQSQLAEHLGLSRQAVSFYVRGRRQVGYAHATRIRSLLAMFGIPCDIEALMKPQAEKPLRDESKFKMSSAAAAMVKSAIDAGLLPSLRDGTTRCTDCDKPADRYDHRNYAEPLVVDPVCASCNALRGPAVFILPRAA